LTDFKRSVSELNQIFSGDEFSIDFYSSLNKKIESLTSSTGTIEQYVLSISNDITAHAKGNLLGDVRNALTQTLSETYGDVERYLNRHFWWLFVLIQIIFFTSFYYFIKSMRKKKPKI
jgi:hypothetical protein